jgi:SNF2 family DNA or RNA helicase
LYGRGEIDAVMIVAPNGVHRNWIKKEIPIHTPDRLADAIRGHIYQTKRSNTKWHKLAVDEVTRHRGLAVLAFSYDAFLTPNGKRAAWEFLKTRKVFYIADESHHIKGPGTRRTKSVVSSAKYAPYKRLLTGTPVAQGPLDLYSQMTFLDENFWVPYRFKSFTVFKRAFCVIERLQRSNAMVEAERAAKAAGKRKGRIHTHFDHVVGYRNVDRLARILQGVSSRVTKDDVLDLPPKVYGKRMFDLLPEQRRIYDTLKEEAFLWLEGGVVDAPNPMVLLLRLQQVTCGYIPTETAEGEEAEPIDLVGDDNPRIAALNDWVANLEHPAIIWARFTKDIDQIMAMLAKEYPTKRAVRYDGSMTDEELARSDDEFSYGDADWMVGNPAKGSEGLTWIRARSVGYYNNSFRYIHRLQSEDRPHRIGQENQVDYADFMAVDTVDEGIIDNLRGKFDIATQLTGDKLKEWI